MVGIKVMTSLEEVISMFPGAGCGQMSAGGWILMALFWATYLGLVLWALSRLFTGTRGSDGSHQRAGDLDLRRDREQMDTSDYPAQREGLTSSGRPRDGGTPPRQVD